MSENTERYLGIIEIKSIENNSIKEGDHTVETYSIKENGVQFVHYPDCQQLSIWLPQNGRDYGTISLYDKISSKLLWTKSTNEFLSGSIKLLIDSTIIPEGDLKLIINKAEVVEHIISLIKYKEGFIPEKPVVIPEKVDLDKPPIVYRDGFGNIIPDLDLMMRGQFYAELTRKFSRKVEFVNMGRSNKVIYIDGEKTASFYSDLTYGDCLFYIDIPSKDHWEKETGFSLAERDEILDFVATETLRKQTVSAGAYFEIEDRGIGFYKPKK